jgi:hypothetical protein
MSAKRQKTQRTAPSLGPDSKDDTDYSGAVSAGVVGTMFMADDSRGPRTVTRVEEETKELHHVVATRAIAASRKACEAAIRMMRRSQEHRLRHSNSPSEEEEGDESEVDEGDDNKEDNTFLADYSRGRSTVTRVEEETKELQDKAVMRVVAAAQKVVEAYQHTERGHWRIAERSVRRSREHRMLHPNSSQSEEEEGDEREVSVVDANEEEEEDERAGAACPTVGPIAEEEEAGEEEGNEADAAGQAEDGPVVYPTFTVVREDDLVA